ncbi:hypothetical protein H5410_004060 [Solanum commersonii]|uniref:Uncharacterized protein n=1 Tax=Solanum commersonii TaxID=4109 RepID=A0A9J6B7E1_SOLCO|nr:hypothetical protein H5410_004060 [Solanum commersonii]
MAPLFPVLVDVTKKKGSDNEFGPPLTTSECHCLNELIMPSIYGLEMLCHQNGCRASTEEQLGQVEMSYPLNVHAKALLGINPEFHEPVDDDIPTDGDKLRSDSNVDSNSGMNEVDLV